MQSSPGSFFPLVPDLGFAVHPQAAWDLPLQPTEQPAVIYKLGDQEEVIPPKPELPSPDSGVRIDFDDELTSF